MQFAGRFDWISPLWTFVQDYRNRPSVGYNLHRGCGRSAYEIRYMLTRAGVKVWGLREVGDVITFRVRRAQARYAQYLLDRAGLPYVGGVRARRSRKGV